MLRCDVIIELPAPGPGDPMSSAAAKKQRPKYLSLPAILFQIRLPLPGWVSILHRVSGALLVFPFAAWALYLLDVSLRSEQGFSHAREYLAMPLAKLGLLVLAWAYCHHFCAGIRYLVLDLNKGIELRPARVSAGVVIVLSLVLTAFFASRIW
jgi:succinate dehydrogenase / fumarate reductase cytochrome b subunit